MKKFDYQVTEKSTAVMCLIKGHGFFIYPRSRFSKSALGKWRLIRSYPAGYCLDFYLFGIQFI